MTKTYANLPKPQDLQISIHKIKADILKTLETIYIYLNGEKYRPQDISPINIFSFVTLKNEILDFLGLPY